MNSGKIYCIYAALNEEMVLEHARRGGFRADRIEIVRFGIDPGTADMPALAGAGQD